MPGTFAVKLLALSNFAGRRYLDRAEKIWQNHRRIRHKKNWQRDIMVGSEFR